MSWIVAGLDGRGGGFNDNADGFGSIVQGGGGFLLLVRLEGGRRRHKIQREWTGDLG